jgi:hypothetical protein
MGEKYHFDKNFDTWTTNNSGQKMHQVSAWGWLGGMKGSGHVFGSPVVPLNFTVGTSPTFNDQDARYSTWGSGHMGGMVGFVMCDGSAKFVNESIDVTTLARASTRAQGPKFDSNFNER